MSDINLAPDLPAIETPADDAPEAPRSLRDELAANFAADAAKQAAEPAAEALPGVHDERPRNERGQFTKPSDIKAPEPKTPSTSGEPRAAAPTAPIGAEPAKPEAIVPPASWSPAAKAAFPTLPEPIRQEVLSGEGEINAGLAQRSQDAERLNRLHSVLGPRSEWFRLNGVNEAQAVEQLFAASDYLQRDPVGALLYLSRQAGVDPRHLAQVFTGEAPQQATTPPDILQLRGEVQTLKQSLQQQHDAAEQAQMDQMLSEVSTFASDPAHVYFENVREPMAALVRSGQATSLDEAYEQAIWAHKDIRPLLLQEQVRTQAQATEQAARARAAQARHASGSITGSPSPGVTPGQAGSAPRSLREELEHNFAEFST